MAPPCIDIRAPVAPEHERILTPDALDLIGRLTREFRDRRDELLARREQRQAEFDAGRMPRFLDETAAIRTADWTVAPAPKDLQDRRVEITGPSADRKMVINALNSGANCYMADFEDSQTPTWQNTLQGQANLCDAIRRTIAFEKDGKQYALKEQTAALLVRPRGWHLPEAHIEVDGRPAPGSLVDFGLYMAHNARQLLDRGTGPYFYLPKMESHLEARLWNDVFRSAQDALGIPRGSVKATCLIETFPAAFEMDEFLHELREHSAGLNCGRWDYIFSTIKTLNAHPGFLFPDRSRVTMDTLFLKNYMDLLVQTCHKRGAHAMGGMSALIPVKDPAANEAALGRIRQDKLREVEAGHDGAWVAHPGLVAVVREVFDKHMPTPNQIHRKRDDVQVASYDLLRTPTGPMTEQGIRSNISIGVQYMESWLRGVGCAALNSLMEDAATAEISRTQLWQGLKHGARLDDGRALTRELFDTLYQDELGKLPATETYARAGTLFYGLSTADRLAPFLTLPAYEHIKTVQPR
jgi:malate synthase